LGLEGGVVRLKRECVLYPQDALVHAACALVRARDGLRVVVADLTRTENLMRAGRLSAAHKHDNTRRHTKTHTRTCRGMTRDSTIR
jgi:hypothetical protein